MQTLDSQKNENMYDNKLKSIIASLLLIIFCILVSATLSSGLGTDNLSLEAFTVDPPVSEKWQNQSKPKHLLYGCSIGDRYSTFTLEAREYPISPEPIDSISSLYSQIQNLEQKRIKTQNNGRYEMTSHSEEILKINNLKCVKYQKRWIDHGDTATQNTELIGSSLHHVGKP
ncbi:hypothetical protein [Desulfogranum japonicum]|uniref:hypothetical protein n=1 Tax=Desulfogranum japonicum TaxID=231447 RepID=UPI00048B0285|nr:hypothetical protein [Desulfogranum japonicum]